MFVHRSNRMEALVEALGEVVSRPLSAPLVPEVIVVASRGMERWLSMRLAERLGVWSNAVYPFPRAFIESVFEAVQGSNESARRFTRETLRWSIAGRVEELASRPSFAPVQRYLDPNDPLKRFHLAGRVAEVFDQYAVYRPELVLDWRRGDTQDWQAELWRELEARLGSAHFAERAKSFFEAWQRLEARPVGLPERVSLVGVSHLPPLFLKLLAAISQRVELHLFLLVPSREYTGDLRTNKEIRRIVQRTPGQRTASELHLSEGHPLVASLGAAGRDFERVLESVAEYSELEHELFEDPAPRTLLSMLQADMLALRERSAATPGSPPLGVADGDHSIQIHSCHSPLREVEVLRDQLLAAFDADRTLEPNDVVVMAPDIEPYAPLIDALFNIDPRDPLYLPYRIADRSQRREMLVVKAFLAVLAALRGRMKASEVLDLLALSPIRLRFGIRDDELPRLRKWIHDSGIRWGVDAADRRGAGVPETAQNTWHFGLARLFLGYAMPGDGFASFGGVLPHDDVEGSTTEALGKLAELCQRLFGWRRELAAARSMPEWRVALSALLDELLAASEPDEWQLALVQGALATLEDHTRLAEFDEPIPLELVEQLLTAHFDQERSSHDFLSSGITFCSMLPMRSIPFRLVYLLGMHDTAFPRTSRSASFDLIAAQPALGDRSVRGEDRYLFLEALLSARERFVVSYVGQSVQDGSERPPSVVIGELLDTIRTSFRPAPPSKPTRQLGLFLEPPQSPSAGDLIAQIVVKHPLQAFSPRYFSGDPRLFSYGLGEAAGAEQLQRQEFAAPVFQRQLLPEPSAAQTLDLESFTRFFENPAKAFLQAQIGLILEGEPDLVDDREPCEPDALERYEIGALLLDWMLAGRALEDAEPMLRARGLLPIGNLGSAYFGTFVPELAAIVGRARRWADGPERPPLSFELPLGMTLLCGALRGLHARAQVQPRYSRVRPKHELGAWIRHLVLAAVREPEGPDTTVLVGRPLDPDAATPVASVRFLPIESGKAQRLLGELVQLYWLGQRVPLCLFPASSKAYVSALRKHAEEPDAEATALAAALEAYRARPLSPARGELDDPYVARAFGDTDALAAQPYQDCPATFPELSRSVFEPLLDHRVEGD